MPLPQLQTRLAQLPLVLAGPLLRRTTATEVTVWLALKEARKATLTVREVDGSGNATGPARATGTRTTVAVGDNLHVVAITATAPAATPLQPGRTYVYDVAFGPTGGDETAPVAGSTETLLAARVVADDAVLALRALTYDTPGAPRLPSFAIAPATPADLRVIHGSCRKPHASGDDALAAADAIVASALSTPARRPHLLLLTGDQIYADDVADVLLAVAADAAPALLGFDEQLPTAAGPRVASVFLPGERKRLVADDARLTTEDGGSHLLSFGEYCAMYLLAFGTAIWPEALPVAEDFAPSSRGFFADHRRTKELRAVRRWWAGLAAVRRALANIPTLTVFDDHEITDDWNLRGSWMRSVLAPDRGSRLGRRVVQNGLAAFALFQAWGNTPAQFAASGDEGRPGRDLLAALARWRGQDSGAALDAIAAGVGMPTGFDADSAPQTAPGALAWHYAVTTPSFQLLALDTRTQRASPGGEGEPAALLGAPGALQRQLRDVPAPDGDVPVLVISPTPVFGNPLMEWLVSLGQSLGMPLYFDAETWGLQPAARERFLSALLTRGRAAADGVKRQRVVLLCGDVHYGFSARVDYRGSITPAGVADGVRAAVAQLTASPSRNESGQTRFLHWIGYEPFGNKIPRETVVGFANLGGGTVTLGTAPLTGAVSRRGTPAFGPLPEGGTPNPAADWRYELEFLLADTESTASRGPLGPPVQAPPPGDRAAALAQYLDAAGVHANEYVGRFGSGKEIVGRNTIGEVTFRWGETDADKHVVHELWWTLPEEVIPYPLSRWSISLANGAAADAGVRLHVTDAAGNATPLANAWVYVRGGAPARLTTLRTEADGRLVERRGTERDAPWDYGRAWAPRAGDSVEIAFTRGARPVPEAVLERAALARAFQAATIPAPGGPTGTTIVLRDARIAVTRPDELGVWPLLWQSPDAVQPWLVAGAGGIDADGRTYEKAGLPQRQRAYTRPDIAGNLTVADGTANAVPAAARLRARGLRVEASVPADATRATVELLDRAGAVVRQRDGFAPTARLLDVAPATLAAAAGGRRALTADVLIDPDAVVGALGHVQLLIVCETPAGPRIEATAALLTGTQLALVDDPAPETRGTQPSEADDVVIVDFGADEQPDGTSLPASPQLTAEALANCARVRRMKQYPTGVYEALYDPSAPAAVPANPLIPKPRMPRLMAELQLAGADLPALRDLMRRRWHRRDVDPATPRPVELLELRVEADWRMLLTWQGMDARSGTVGGGYPNPHIAHSHVTALTDSSLVRMRFNEDGDLCDPDGRALRLPADGTVPDAMAATVLPAWVEARRRTPVVLAAAARPWGREAAAPNRDALVVEWLPLVERVRGGDGVLELTELRVGRETTDAEAVHGGRVPGATAASVADAAADLPPARLPRFRVPGVNPTAAQVDQLVEALVDRRLPGIRARPSIALLADICWRTTARLIVAWENGHHGQYDPAAPARRRWRRNGVDYFVGRERGMPTFGPPHGYGLGQLDNWNAPPVGPDPDMVWDFVANAEQVLTLIFDDKAASSFATLNAHPPGAAAAAADRARFRALHQRETVRRYNGGNEFVFRARDGRWRIDPPAWLDPSNVPYPNQVLGTGVNYGDPRPIELTAADFGPESGTVP